MSSSKDKTFQQTLKAQSAADGGRVSTAVSQMENMKEIHRNERVSSIHLMAREFLQARTHTPVSAKGPPTCVSLFLFLFLFFLYGCLVCFFFSFSRFFLQVPNPSMFFLQVLKVARFGVKHRVLACLKECGRGSEDCLVTPALLFPLSSHSGLSSVDRNGTDTSIDVRS